MGVLDRFRGREGEQEMNTKGTPEGLETGAGSPGEPYPTGEAPTVSPAFAPPEHPEPDHSDIAPAVEPGGVEVQVLSPATATAAPSTSWPAADEATGNVGSAEQPTPGPADRPMRATRPVGSPAAPLTQAPEPSSIQVPPAGGGPAQPAPTRSPAIEFLATGAVHLRAAEPDTPPDRETVRVGDAVGVRPDDLVWSSTPDPAPTRSDLLEPNDPEPPLATGEPSQPAVESLEPLNPAPPAASEQPASSRRPLVFGPMGTLKPAPRRTAQPVLALVPDTALDWVDTTGLAVRAAACRGHMKRYEGEVRQDAFALGQYEGFYWVAVGDGVGSAAHSHFGSSLATAAAVGGMHTELAAQARDLLGRGGAALVQLDGLAADLGIQASRLNTQALELSTTLVLAAIPVAAAQSVEDGESDRIDVVLWQIGDSPSGLIRDGLLSILSPDDPAVSALANSAVEALPLHSEARVWVEHLHVGDTLVLMTDGVSNIVAANAEYRAALALLWQQEAPTPAALLEVVDATVKSFDDDRTFAGVRFAATGAR